MYLEMDGGKKNPVISTLNKERTTTICLKNNNNTSINIRKCKTAM